MAKSKNEFSPVQLQRGDHVVVAYSNSTLVQLKFDGYAPVVDTTKKAKGGSGAPAGQGTS